MMRARKRRPGFRVDKDMSPSLRPFARTIPQASTQAQDDPPTPGAVIAGVLLFLRRNPLRIALVALAVTAPLLALGYFLRQYSATAVIMVDPRAAKITQNSGVLANIGQDFNAIESIVQIAKSDGFMGAVVDKLELTHDSYFAGKGTTEEALRQSTIEKLASKLIVSRRGTTYVIDVTVSSPSPEKSAKVANSAAQVIVDDQARLRIGASEMTAKEIEGRLSQLRDRANRAEEAAADLKAKLKITDAGQGSTLLERRIYELNQQLVLAGARTAEARARYELLRKAGASAGDNLPQTVQSTVLSALRSEYARLSRQAADQATVLGPRHPEVASLQAQIGDVRRQIGAEIGRMMASARTEYLEAEQREATLSSQLRSAQAESGQLGPELVKLSELDREAKAERAVYEELLNRQRQLAQVKGLEPSDIRIVSPALPPTKTTPPMMVIFGGAAGIGLVTGLLYAFIREWRHNTLKTASQAKRLGGVEVLGCAPLLPPAKDEEKGFVLDITPWIADLCAELGPVAGGENGVVIMIASARRGEGRSTVAVNMAAFLAQGGDRVLLIEADRPPNVKRPRYGLLDVLDTGEDLNRALIEQPADGYTLLPYGGRTIDPQTSIGGLMSGMTLRATLKLARKWFDVVIIDGPPALEAPHARFLAAQADHTVFLVEWDKTSSADANLALDRLDLREATAFYNKADAARLRLYDPEQSRQMTNLGDEMAHAA